MTTFLLVSTAIPLGLLIVLAVLGYRERRRADGAAKACSVVQPIAIDRATLTPRQIEMRCDRIELALVTHWSRPDLTRFYVSSPDGYSFYVSGPNAERIVEDQRNEFGPIIGDNGVQVHALEV